MASPVQNAALVAARAARNHKGTEIEADARRHYAEVKITDTIRRIVDKAPPLKPEQRDRIALALKGRRL